MSLQPGDRIGGYEILSALGAGGMGVVYRARDTKLGREVAIKTLPDAVVADGERLARFEREARALAALNHVNIASVYGFEQAGATHLLVMELVPGETLADWIARGPIAIDRALPLFLQIAAGLEAAHAKGIIHRDLKPANIKIAGGGGGARGSELKPGAVKILDFGLAKALARDDAAMRAAEASRSPTLTLEATMRGELLGTAAYMSPEQALGEPADARADIWAFGVCLYEALTGRRAFGGSNLSYVLASVLKDEPDLATLPAGTPPLVRRLLRRCLEKDRERRLHDIADARLEIEEAMAVPAAEEPASGAVSSARTRRLRVAIAAAAGVLLGIASAIGVAAWLRPVPLSAPLARYVLTAPPNEVVAESPMVDLTITRDGRSVFYVTGATAGSTTLRVRRLDQLEGVPVEGAERGAVGPFLSPDERWIGYTIFQGFDQISMRAVPIEGGPSRLLCACAGVGPSWGEGDTIVFGSRAGPLQAVELGGEPRDLVALAEGETSHRSPEFLPGGRALLFAAFRGVDPARAAIHVLSLATGERELLVSGASQPRYVASGHLLYTADAKLWAVPFDAERLELLGEPAPVLDGVAFTSAGLAKYALSQSGALAYIAAQGEAPRRTLVWMDRAGGVEAIAAPPRNYSAPRLSPDGTRIVFGLRDAANHDIWIWDLERSVPTRLTMSPGRDLAPMWSADGQAIFHSTEQEGGGWDAFRMRADGVGEAIRLTEQRRFLIPVALTPDGSSLLAMSGATDYGPWELVQLDAAAKSEPTPLLETEARVPNAELSPDGRWLAYVSYESGHDEVFVRPFPAVERGHWQVSTGGGRQPAWARDGKEIFFLDPASRLMGATVATRSEALVLGEPRLVVGATDAPAYPGRSYDVSPDGRRFLMIKGDASPAGDASGRIVLLQGWVDELRRLAPVGPRSRERR